MSFYNVYADNRKSDIKFIAIIYFIPFITFIIFTVTSGITSAAAALTFVFSAAGLWISEKRKNKK